jgi:phenylpropionate dioxygenase-like ring-hydroxylating dioxygenase large terminal subunit
MNLIQTSMDEQLARNQYPTGFPALSPVPSARYANPGFAEAEMRHLWKKTWLLAGLESELPQVGSYLLFEQLGLSVIITRGKDEAIRAFHNTCRHRSAALVVEPKGKTVRFVCPYHAWSYALDGKLVSVPEEYDFACLDKSERGLSPVRCESWRGIIFINADPEAASLADFVAPVKTQIAGFPLEKLVVKDHFSIDLECNWKLAFHNFIEIYHLDTVHPKSLKPFLDKKSFVVSMLNNGHSRIAVRKQKGNSIYKTEVPVPDSVDEVFKRFIVILPLFPNTSMAIDPSGFAIQTFWPVGVNKSKMDVHLVGLDGDCPTDPAYWSALRVSVETLLSEDSRLFAGIQRGVTSGSLQNVLMSYQERAIYWFEEEIDRRIGVHNIPEEMRVTPLLADLVNR